MSLHVRRPIRLLSLAVYALMALGLALVIAARALDGHYVLALAGVGCWVVAFGILLGHAGPHGRRRE